MGDLPPGSGPQTLDISAAGLAQDDHQGLISPHSASLKSPGQNAPFYSQFSSLPQSQMSFDPRAAGAQQHSAHPPQELGASSLNMGPMAGALPDYGNNLEPGQGNPQTQRPLSGASTSALVYQLQQNMQMPAHAQATHPSYGPGYGQPQFPQGFAPAQGSQHGVFPPYPGNQQQRGGPNLYQGFQQPSQYLYYPSPYGPQGQFPPGFSAQAAQQQAMFGRRSSGQSGQMPMMGQGLDMQLPEAGYSAGRMMSGGAPGEVGPIGQMLGAQGSRSGSVSSIPRGPPRKPKQSGHALWVGNLPPGTTVLDLKDHFSRDATKDIESLFLISKSNCAFVNYRTEASCTAAMHRFHDSRFHGVRLVCRLRRSSTPASGVPTGPAAMVGQGQQGVTASPPRSPLAAVEGETAQPDGVDTGAHQVDGENTQQSNSSAKEKYFVVKSLTLQDLELSVRNGIWATQSHNEDVLNKAYESAESVYLIFSANKSGEYFGYARMASPILENSQHLLPPNPQLDVIDSPDVPKSIPTPATEFAPKGRIIDDSARGTIFWEAELSDVESEGEKEKEEEKDKEVEQPQHDGLGGATGGDASVAQSWGKPFKVEWVSTNRLPFYRTRGLRNPWNANREVKIARDGTELETSVGERLVQMFHRLGPSSAGGAPPMMPSGPPMVGPVPQMRPPFGQ